MPKVKAEKPKGKIRTMIENFANLPKDEVVEQKQKPIATPKGSVKWIANAKCYIGGKIYEEGDTIFLPEGEDLACAHKA